MKQLLIASNNPGKISEIKHIFAELHLQLLTSEDIDLIDFDVEETGTTFQENALLKARSFAQKTGLPTLADDSGLSVDALAGQPGVYSKRYGTDDDHRNSKLLKELKDIKDPHRTARFTAVVCVYNPETKDHFCEEGSVEGKIAHEVRKKGDQGFGYDPLFIPDEIKGDQTFAQLGPQVKNTISHRSRALGKIVQKLSDKEIFKQ